MKPALAFLIYVFIFPVLCFCQGDCKGLQKLADSLHQAGQYQEATNVYTQIIGLKCGYLQTALNNRGSMYDDMQKYDSAFTDLSKAYILDSTEPITLVNFGVHYASQNNFKQAIGLLNKAIKYSKKPSWIFNIRGGVRSASGDSTGPVDDYKGAINADKHNIKAYNNLIKTYRALGDADGEENAYDSVIANNPGHPGFIEERGFFYYRQGRYDEAIKDYTTFLTIAPDDYETYVNRALCYERSEKQDKALKDYTTSITIKENYLAYYNRARLYHKWYNNYKLAIKDNLKCIELNPGYATAYLNLGNCYIDTKQYDKAKEAFETGMTKNPTPDTKEKLEWQLQGFK